MRRIAVLILLFILLAEAPISPFEPPTPKTIVTIQKSPLVLDLNNSVHGYGPLQLYNVWRLSSSEKLFGGLSSLLVQPDGRFLALSDSGDTFDFSIGDFTASDYIQSLPRFSKERTLPRSNWDSESMTRDPVTGKIWVGFERIQRICRYSANFAEIEACASPPELAAWPSKGSIESLVRFSDGRFLAIEEVATGPEGRNDVLLWSGDPTDKKTPRPVHLSYEAPTGYRPTDALWLGGDRLLVLNRRLTMWSGFTAKLVMVKLPPLRAGAILKPTPVADFVSPGPKDNMEALALQRDPDRPMLFVASDDNHSMIEKTLIFRFSLPKDWISDAPAP